MPIPLWGMAFQIFYLITIKIGNCCLSHFWVPIYLCNKGHPNFCDMGSKSLPKYSSFMIFRVWVVVVAACHTHQKMDEVALWSYIDSSISLNWFGDTKLFLLQQLNGSNAFQMSKKNKQKFHSVWHSNYLEINFCIFWLISLRNKGLWLGLKLQKVCQYLNCPIYISNAWGFGGIARNLPLKCPTFWYFQVLFERTEPP